MHQLINGPLDDHAATVDDCYAGAELLDLVKLVRREENSPPTILPGHEPAQKLSELRHGDRVQPRGRLIEDQQIRISEHRHGNPALRLHPLAVCRDLAIRAPVSSSVSNRYFVSWGIS